MSQLPPHVTDEFYSELVGNLQTFGFCDDEESKTARMSVQHGTRCCSLPTACHAYTYTNLHDSHAACPPLPLPTQRRSTRPARRAGTSSLTKTAPCSSGTTYDHPILPARHPPHWNTVPPEPHEPHGRRLPSAATSRSHLFKAPSACTLMLTLFCHVNASPLARFMLLPAQASSTYRQTPTPPPTSRCCPRTRPRRWTPPPGAPRTRSYTR